MDNIIPVFYSEYGRYISRSRMIPSNIDGLIPVNRRLLLVMHKIAKKTTKSARIVGETIGTLHAHGDCLRGSTLIPLLDGSLVPISELCGKEPQWVLTYDKEKQDYIPTKAHSWRVGQITKELYKIHLSNGGIIECTANHPFLLNTQKWSRADELNCGDVLFGGLIYIDKNYKTLKTHNKHIKLHRHVYEHFTHNNLAGVDIIHHKDNNKINNIPENLELTDRSAHAKCHITQKHIDCLARGRETMFSANSLMREKIYKKNKELRNLICKTTALRKAIKVIKYLKENNLELTKENYYLFGKNIVYNLTKLETIEKKYNLDFDKLIEIAPTWKANTSSAIGLTKNNLKRKKKQVIKYKINKLCSELIFKVFNKLNNFNPTWDEYISTAKKLSNYANIVYSNKNKLCKKLNIQNPADILKHISADCGVYIIKIEKIILDKPEEFYDFTVDNYHNMIIATTNDVNNINFVIAHNSSAYGSLVNLVYDGYADSSKSTWGGPGLVDVPAPASRYTETSILPWVEKLAFEFIDFVPWELLELSEEPLYLPSPIPIGLVGDGIISGISYHKTVIPRYDKKDLVKRLLWLIQNGKPQKPVDISEELDPKIYGPCIKPKKEDCDVDEFSKNDFYKLLIFGEGKVIYKPKANIITEKKQTFLEILGKAPLSTFQPMLNAYSKNLLPFTEKPIDQSKKTNIRILAPLKKNISNTFLNEFKENYLNKPISFKCYFCDLDGKVNQYGVDDILLNSFNHWYQALLKKLLNDIYNINYKLFLNTISFMIKNILHNNKKIMSVDDIIKNFDFNQKIKQYDYQNKKWIILNKEITETDIRETCKNVSIQKLIEYHSIEENLKEQFQLIKNNIDNINNYILIKIKDVI